MLPLMPFYHDISFWRHSAPVPWAVFIVPAGHSRAAPLVRTHKEQQRRNAQTEVAVAELEQSTGLRYSLSGHGESRSEHSRKLLGLEAWRPIPCTQFFNTLFLSDLPFLREWVKYQTTRHPEFFNSRLSKVTWSA